MNAPARFFRSIDWVRWCSIFFSAFALMVAYVAYETYAVLPRIYLAESVIEVPPQGAIGPDEASPATVVEILQTPDVLLPIITDLRLDRIWAKREFNGGLDALPPQDALKYMKAQLKFLPIEATHIIHIQFCSIVPKEAADVANALADRYKTLRDMEVDRLNLRERGTLRGQIAVQQVVLQEKTAIGDAHQIALQQAVLAELNLRLKQLNDESESEESPVNIIARAEPPDAPYLPDYGFEMSLAIPKGIWAGIVVATLVELFIWVMHLTAASPWNQGMARNASEEY